MRCLARGSLNAAVSFYGIFIEDTRFLCVTQITNREESCWRFFFCIDLGFIGFYLFGSELGRIAFAFSKPGRGYLNI